MEARHRLDELERRPHRPFGVVLVRDRGAPEGHHGIADELLDGAAVAFDDGAGGVEVAGQKLARVLGVASLRGGREADEVGEEDADEPALRYRLLLRRLNRARCGSATAPHSEQNFASGARGAEHDAHVRASVAPHSEQNFAPIAFSVPQAPQLIVRL